MIPTPANSDLLIAPPGIPDKRFSKSVLMLTHDQNGHTHALCLNKPTRHTLQDVLLDTGIETPINFPIYWGGPVNPATVWMLHSAEWNSEHTIYINSDWAMTSNISMFHHLADGDCPQYFRIMFGYCTWAPGQLRAELRGQEPWSHRHSWLVAHNPGTEWVFEMPTDELWDHAAQLSGHQAIDSWL